jgi:energy-converting hydrogenase Eha subunit C
VIGALPQPAVSAYRVAIEQTTGAINRRAKYFRNLIVSVAMVSLGSIICAAGTQTFWPLIALLLLFPACTLFFLLDAILMNDWRSRLLESWTRKQLDFEGLRLAVATIPSLPKNTVQGMLATLPRADDLVAEQGVSRSTRGALAVAIGAIDSCAADALAFKVASHAIVSCSLGAAAVVWTWKPLLGIIAVGLLLLATRVSQRLRLRVATFKTIAAQGQPDFDARQYLKVLGGLAWDPISPSAKARFLEGVRPPK